jgi:hypothetical protein
MTHVTTMAEVVTWAEYLPVWNEPIVEGLQGAGCSPACKAIATCAALAWDRGLTAQQWRDDLLQRHHERGDLLLISTAEECMRSSGLWPWNT